MKGALMTTETAETVLREKLATCTRILGMQQMIGLFGHISTYDPDAGRVYMCPGMGNDKTLVQPDDILALDLDGEVLDGAAHVPVEWPIHTVLHRKRADALAVAHLHSPYATLFSITDREYRPVTLQGSIFGAGIPLYGEPGLVKTPEQGNDLARIIGDGRAIFMRGHGIVVVARDVEEMLFASLLLEDEARKWVTASALGEVQPFSAEDCAAFGAEADLSRRSHRAWPYLKGMEERWNGQPGTGCIAFC
jgi:L-fuculose-phosphate aldolase